MRLGLRGSFVGFLHAHLVLLPVALLAHALLAHALLAHALLSVALLPVSLLAGAAHATGAVPLLGPLLAVVPRHHAGHAAMRAVPCKSWQTASGTVPQRVGKAGR